MVPPVNSQRDGYPCEILEETTAQLGPAGEISDRKGHRRKRKLSNGRVEDAVKEHLVP